MTSPSPQEISLRNIRSGGDSASPMDINNEVENEAEKFPSFGDEELGSENEAEAEELGQDPDEMADYVDTLYPFRKKDRAKKSLAWNDFEEVVEGTDKYSSGKAASKELERIDHLFYSYADNSTGMIDPEGIESICSDLNVDHTDVRLLMLAWKMQAERQGYFTLDEWRTSLKALRADTIPKLKKSLVDLEKEVRRPSNFVDFYSYAFRYCLTGLAVDSVMFNNILKLFCDLALKKGLLLEFQKDPKRLLVAVVEKPDGKKIWIVTDHKTEKLKEMRAIGISGPPLLLILLLSLHEVCLSMEDGSGMLPVMDLGKVKTMIMVDESTRKLSSFAVCSLCVCCEAELYGEEGGFGQRHE
ncbi:Domain of unknown function (DUF298 [Striga hermonthica]|uniref:Defective in cullin neddylation protein n=1 Tax=Striga hermonthica TaxID=68872 RepID=A0A9N7NJ22_STRHE|nr:Domain of unknown function (DUF298 [Striga hermonthica]